MKHEYLHKNWFLDSTVAIEDELNNYGSYGWKLIAINPIVVNGNIIGQAVTFIKV